MRLAYAGRAEDQHVLSLGDEASGRKLADKLGVDGGLELKSNSSSVLMAGK
jgi:hypothetical protein